MALINVCGLWENESRTDGSTFLAGNLGYARIMIFPNKNKRDDKSPDWTLCIAEKEDRGGGGRSGGGGQQGGGQQGYQQGGGNRW